MTEPTGIIFLQKPGGSTDIAASCWCNATDAGAVYATSMHMPLRYAPSEILNCKPNRLNHSGNFMHRLLEHYKRSAGCPHSVSTCPVMAAGHSDSNTPAGVMETTTSQQLIFTECLY
jgi:hypothetical protein